MTHFHRRYRVNKKGLCSIESFNNWNEWQLGRVSKAKYGVYSQTFHRYRAPQCICYQRWAVLGEAAAGCGATRRLHAARNTIYGNENSRFVWLVEPATVAGRDGPITTLIYIPRMPRSPTFHEVSSSWSVVQQNRGCAIAILIYLFNRTI